MSGIHPSHKNVRFSDASTFDEICDDCGATDQVPGGWGTLAAPCQPRAGRTPPHTSDRKPTAGSDDAHG